MCAIPAVPVTSTDSGLGRWTAGGLVLLPRERGSFDETAVKDPTLVFSQGRWHLFYTARERQEYTTGYVSAAALDELDSARRYELEQIRGVQSR